MSLTILGDSIAVGTGQQFPHGGKTVAIEGKWPKEIATWDFPAADWVIVSAGSNGNTASEMDALRTALGAIVAKAPQSRWIFILPAQEPARSVVKAFAQGHGDHTISFPAGGDGVHPQSYLTIARAALDIMQAADVGKTSLSPVAALAAQWDPLLRSLIGGQDIHRAAIWGQAAQESNGNPGAIERPGTDLGGIGLWQHTGPRRRALEAYAAQRGKPWRDAEIQVRFMASELLGPEAHSWAQTQKTTTIEAATETFELQNERPAAGTAGLPRRIQGAREALAAIQAAQPQEKPMTDTSGVTATAPAATPIDQLANFIKAKEIQGEDLVRAYVQAHYPQVPTFALDLAFSLLNRIDFVALAEGALENITKKKA